MRIISAAMRSAMVVTASVAFCLSAHAADIYSGSLKYVDYDMHYSRGAGPAACTNADGRPVRLEIDGSKVSYKKLHDTYSGSMNPATKGFTIKGNVVVFKSIEPFTIAGTLNGDVITGTYESGNNLICKYTFEARRSGT